MATSKFYDYATGKEVHNNPEEEYRQLLEEYQELERLGAYDDYSIPQPPPKDPTLANIIMNKINKQKSIIKTIHQLG